MTIEDGSRSLQGRRAIVTGAGNGLGLAIARKFVASGAKVLLVDCDPVVETRPSEAEFPKGSAFALTKDLADADAAPVVFQAARNTLGTVDTLINNAAWSLHRPMLEMPVAEFDRLVAINQRAPFFLATEFFRAVSQAAEKPRDPTIVNLGSINALAGNPELVAYAGTKGAVVAMTRAMAVEMAPLGIRVNSISPGSVDTDFTRKVMAEKHVGGENFFGRNLIQRFASCEEIAELVAYLCSPVATFVTGANWVIDGGFMAR